MSKNILLDRFRWEVVPFFFKYFESNGKKVSIISYSGKEPKGNFCDKNFIFEDFLILKGCYFKNVPWIINTSDLKFYHQHEGLMINLFSRFTISPGNWSAAEMSIHGLNIFNFWKYNLLKKKIDTCFSYYTPHDPASLILYMVSKYLRIPYIFIDSPVIFTNIRHFSCSLENRNLLVQNKFCKTPYWVKKEYINYSKKINKNFISAQPPFMKKNSIGNKFIYFKNKILLIVKKENLRAFEVIIKKLINKIIPAVPPFFKYKRGSWNYNDDSINRFQYLILKLKIILRLRKMKKIYSKLAPKIKNLEKTNYILFSAHVVPEGSILPSAMWNRHTDICLKAIISVLPESWKIIYKVNPLQFSPKAPYSTFVDWYTEDYYKSLITTNKIILAPLNAPTDELIKGSKGVATINGTASLEAPFYKKNSILFSPIWFDKLDGVFLCKNKNDIKKAIHKMKIQEQPHPQLPNNLFSEQTTFKITKFIMNSFIKKDLKTIANKFLSSEKIFKKLGPEKWVF
jgi:hypothetical protein